ncbi:hypothetical protein [Halomonas koreensis]|uniref:AbiV family abortive infection protein n=1 Tax=Halomonas koreensis TaxID=245385 RepID=A0ABU1FYI0_9GAMM|nr:hypothetical protein [Halomonas koreensis]MDR5865689.1 hypothetical protein [Halomonas koreensis]
MNDKRDSGDDHQRKAKYKKSSLYGFNFELLADQAEKAFQSYLDSGKTDIGYLATAALHSLHSLEYILPPLTVRAAARFHNPSATESLESSESKHAKDTLKEKSRLAKINARVNNWINRIPYENGDINPPSPYDNLVNELIDQAPMLFAIENLANHFKHSEARTDSLIRVERVKGFQAGFARAGDTLGMVTFKAATSRSAVRVDDAVQSILGIIRRHQTGKAFHEIIEEELKKEAAKENNRIS